MITGGPASRRHRNSLAHVSFGSGEHRQPKPPRLGQRLRTLAMGLIPLHLIAGATQAQDKTIPLPHDPFSFTPGSNEVPVIPPEIPQLDFSAELKRIQELEGQVGTARSGANSNTQAVERLRTEAKTHQDNYINTGNADERELADAIAVTAREYKERADALTQKANDLNTQATEKKRLKEEAMKAARAKVQADWKKAQNYYMANRVEMYDPHLVHQYPKPEKGFMVASAAPQDQFAWFGTQIGFCFVDMLMKQTTAHPDIAHGLQAAVEQYRGASGNDSQVPYDHPLISTETTTTFNKAENDIMGPHRYVFFLVGERNPADFNEDTEAFRRSVIKLKHHWAKLYNIPASNFIEIWKPGSDAEVQQQLFGRMDEIIEATRQQTKDTIKPEFGLFGIAHGNIYAKDDGCSPRKPSVEGIEPGLPPEMFHLQGAQVGYSVMRNEPRYVMSEHLVKDGLKAREDKMRGGFYMEFGCQGGSKIALNDVLNALRSRTELLADMRHSFRDSLPVRRYRGRPQGDKTNTRKALKV